MASQHDPEVVATSGRCFAPNWMDDAELCSTVVYDREGLVVRFSIPDSADHLLETSLLELLSLYDRLESGTTGTIVVHMGAHLRVTADQPETVLDLTRWTWSESEGEWVVSTPGPAVAGEREAVLEVLADPIREAIGTVEDHGWGVEAVRQRHDSDRTELMTRLSVWERLVE